MTLRHLVEWRKRKEDHLEQSFYTTSRFACRGCVTVRTLRYYDREGLLSPSTHTQAGHRLYCDADLARLQQILALKFLGFSLDEIRQCLCVGPSSLHDALGLQKTMLIESRNQLNVIISAIEHAELALTNKREDWPSIVQLIRVFQMNHDFSKYYTEEQRQKIDERAKTWTAEDQQVAGQRWDAVITEAKRLVAADEDPASPAAQAMAREWHDLVSSFTQGDPGIEKGLGNMYSDLAKMPEEQRPFPMPYDKTVGSFTMKAVDIYRQGK